MSGLTRESYVVSVSRKDGTELAIFEVGQLELGVNSGTLQSGRYLALAVLTALARRFRLGE
jgi:hypothetical protein